METKNVCMQECQIGLNFADEDEAKQFYTAVQKQINENKGVTDSEHFS